MSNIGSQQYTVTTTAAPIASFNGQGNSEATVWITNTSATPVYLGGANVTSSNGYPYTKQNEPFGLILHVGDVLYAVTASSTATVGVLQT